MLIKTRQYLDSMQLEYTVHSNGDTKPWFAEDADDNCQWLRSVALKTDKGSVIAILPFNHMLDFNLLTQFYKKEITPIKGIEADNLFKGCEKDIRVPLPQLFGCLSVCDSSSITKAHVCFESGDGEHYIKITRNQFIAICETDEDCQLTAISFPIDNLYMSQGIKDPNLRDFSAMRIQGRVQEISDLPALPGTAIEIIELKANRFATVADLSAIISKDPALAALIMGWASSAYYGFQGKLDSLDTAISSVLGYDMVINLSLGIVLSQTLKVPKEGPLGLENYWRQAIMTANLSEKLCMRMSVASRPALGLVYLSGLLHNIGHLLLGHAFPPQFFVLNRFIEVNPHIPVSTIEQYVLGVTHEEIGAWLLKNWQLPTEIIDAAKWHHQEEYASPNASYSNLILLSNCILGNHMIGDARPGVLPDAVLELLGLNQQQAGSALNSIESYLPELESLAIQLAA